MQPELDELVVILRGRVSQRLGRCILRLQQYERGVKTLLTHRELAVDTPEDMEIGLVKRQKTFGSQTLGQLFAELTGKHLKPRSTQSDEPPETPASATPQLQISFTMEMDERRYQQICAKLRELLALRNELVHQFTERFDLLTEESCLTALCYLEEALHKIDEHLVGLRNWLILHDQATKYFAEFIASPDFDAFEAFGFFPGQTIHWPGTTIIEMLLDVERELHQRGWTNLKQAIQLIGRRNPEITPRKYGCSSWRHVLQASGLFEVRKEKAAEQGETLTFFRSKP